MSPTAYASQLPRLSQYDPGDVGEGGLDPMGVAAVADRIAELLAPGLRARMSQPRYVTFSALGAYAGMRVNSLVSTDGATTPDIAFEWMTLEALVRGPGGNDLVGLPGIQKARRARSIGDRLNPGNYLRGPRVFGFTGVYRPFSIDSAVLEPTGMPGGSAENLVLAWESDQRLKGFLAETTASNGARLRHEVDKHVAGALRKGESSFPLTGWASSEIARTMTPAGAGPRERAVLRQLILSDQHVVRQSLGFLLNSDPPPAAAAEHEISAALQRHASGQVRERLAAAGAYERCAALLTNAFRRLLRHGVMQAHGVLRSSDWADLPFATQAARAAPNLVGLAVEAAARIDDALAGAVESAFEIFSARRTTSNFVDALLSRHTVVQSSKGKRAWLDEIREGWYVRPPYRDQVIPDDDQRWIHPMRLRTIAQFLAATR